MDPALLAGVDNDDDTSLAGVQADNTSLAGVPIQSELTTTIMTWTQNLITTPLTPTGLMTIQAKHPYTALEAKHQFTV